ncbi:MAG: nuclear transport factor 2 family protein [Ferruginibacter sp.]
MKHSFVKLLGIVVLTAFISSCNSETTKTESATAESAGFNLDSARSAIIASNKIFGETFATGDSTTFAGLYTSDACLSVTGMPRMCGTAAITAFFNGGYQMGMRKLAITTEEVMGGKEAVVETGKYEVFMAENVSVDKGKFIVVWKEENGKWKMHRDIWNSDLPQAPAAK